ncbi:hypothetical protein PILCRDRAFT_15190 [Piloderma croceum F 1598]|uniref:Uncharacterized protein n=1 Tax=Piloderma croceum (strain F 1598) TaxID=765440 RepID=A0A0C3AI93_PILCF|nr:hypothetical protein PILCRDRAFT_15190 [Piloderma croceum F 1598]
MTNHRDKPDASQGLDDELPRLMAQQHLDEDDRDDSEPRQRSRQYYDDAPGVSVSSVPNMPYRQTRGHRSRNLHLELDIPCEFAQFTQITWSMTPHGTPVNTHVPNTSRQRAAPIPAPDFGSLPSQEILASSNVDVFGSPATRIKTESPSKHTCTPSATSNPSDTPRHQRSRMEHCTVLLTGAADPPNIGILIDDNEIHGVDPSWPVPVYPLIDGETHPDEPLPNIPVAPRRYYVIFKGLCPGVYYDKWQPLEVLCKNLKGGTGHWRGFPTLCKAICKFEKGEKVVILNIGHH